MTRVDRPSYGTVADQGRTDQPPLIGATLFGIGWGFVGLCRSPALEKLTTLSPGIIVFVAAMVGGMQLRDAWWIVAEMSDLRTARRCAWLRSTGNPAVGATRYAALARALFCFCVRSICAISAAGFGRLK